MQEPQWDDDGNIQYKLDSFNRGIWYQDIVSYGLCFLSWGAIFGFPYILCTIIGVLVGTLVFFLFRRPNRYGGKMISGWGGAGCFFAIAGLIGWGIKALINGLF